MAKEKKSKFMQPMQISEELTAVVGRGPMPRTEVTKKLWAYIKAHKCQDTKNRRNIIRSPPSLRTASNGSLLDDHACRHQIWVFSFHALRSNTALREITNPLSFLPRRVLCCKTNREGP